MVEADISRSLKDFWLARMSQERFVNRFFNYYEVDLPLSGVFDLKFIFLTGGNMERFEDTDDYQNH